jgi:hypothetical protein
MNTGFLGLPGFNPDVAAGPWGNAAIPIRAVANGTQLVISARSREGGVLGGGGPARVMFPNGDIGVADYKARTIAQPVPPIVIASGSTMGFTSGVPGKLWVILIDDIAGPRLGVINARSGFSVYPLGQLPLISTLALGGGASAGKQPYSTRAIASRSYIVLGSFTWSSALATAGTWNANPGVARLFGPNVKLPGSEVQMAFDDKTDITDYSGASFADIAGLTASLALTDAANIVRGRIAGQMCTVSGTRAYLRAVRDSTVVLQGDVAGNRARVTQIISNNEGSGGDYPRTFSIEFCDLPGDTSSHDYKLTWAVSSGGGVYLNKTQTTTDAEFYARWATTISAQEIQA